MPLSKNTDLSRLSSYGLAATTRYFFEITSIQELSECREIYRQIRSKNLPICILAGGTNILFAFDEFPGLIIKNSLLGKEVGDSIATLASAESVSRFALMMDREYGCPRFRPWIGLPGTIGGAAIGNAGCFGLEMKDVLMSLDVYNLQTNTHETISNSDLQYSYRNSRLKGINHLLVTSVRISLAPSSVTPDYPERKSPPGRSCGSYFRNPEWQSAGRLIELCGLKWTKIGNAKISEIHGNYIINECSASYHDILDLAELAKKSVREQFGIELIEEVRILTTE
jgi:UDP-N-acetylmuramate dehydrogenase